MDLSLSMEQDDLKKTARKFLADFCPDTLVREMEGAKEGFPLNLWQEMAKLGWQGIVIPEEFGGAGMGFFELVILLEEMGRACLPGPFFCTVALGGLLIQEFGNDRQKRELLPAVSKGEAIITLAHSEPACGWFTDKVEMEAKPSGQDYVIRGTKIFVPYAHAAQWMIVSVQVEGKISLFLLSALEIKRNWHFAPIYNSIFLVLILPFEIIHKMYIKIIWYFALYSFYKIFFQYVYFFQ